MQRRQYSDAEKIAYYKRKASARSRASYQKPQRPKAVRKPKSSYKYPGLGRRIGGYAGSAIGNMVAPGIGGVVGDALGSVVGQGAHALVKNITGFGDYKVSKNSLVYNVDSVPEFSVNNERCTMITHREFIGDIRSGPTTVGSSTAFNIQEYRINPTIPTTFPWLASIAENYEQYVVQGMVFEYKTTSATAIGSTNTALGTVILATQYNSLAQDFSNKQQMENYEFSQSTVPSQSVLHPIECDPLQTQCGGIFNNYIPGADSGDIRLYDIGRFNIATVGMQTANVVIGELWVSYKICLLKPRITGVSEVADYYTLDVSDIVLAKPLGDASAATLAVSSSGFTELSGNKVVYIDESFFGVVMLVLSYRIVSPSLTQMPLIVCTGNCTDVTHYYSGASASGFYNYAAPTVAGNGDMAYTVSFVKCNGGYTNSGLRQTITYNSLGGLTVAPSQASLLIMSVPSNLILF